MASSRTAAYLLLALAALLMACSGRLGARRLADQPYASRPLPDQARIFLIAGGVDVANFAEEVVRQRSYWRAAGVPDEAIACYYAKPTLAAYHEDAQQYRAITRALADCYPARAGLIRAHLALASRRDLPYLYLYISSHGRPQLVARDVAESLDVLSAGEVDLLDQYFLQMGADPGYGVDASAIVNAARRGEDPDDLLLTPASLGRALARFAPQLPKIVVLQGCHSGGFLNDQANAAAAQMTALRNLTVIAAARHDRTSFGCDPGARMTYFGLIFLRLLLEHAGPQTPTSIPWPGLFDQLAAEVHAIELRQEVTPSEPVFFSTAATGRSACALPCGR
ncbi:MAG: hypothetical protein R3A51_10840 [Nannocystaceae bacterium]|nr:hypothetical protein [Myxococcales bacterium]